MLVRVGRANSSTKKFTYRAASVGPERCELAIEQNIELRVVRRTPFGVAQVSGVEQRIGDAALEETKFARVAGSGEIAWNWKSGLVNTMAGGKVE